MRVPKENGLQMLLDLYRKYLPIEFQLTLTFLEATDEGLVALAVTRFRVLLNRSGCALVTLELEDFMEHSNVDELIEPPSTHVLTIEEFR